MRNLVVVEETVSGQDVFQQLAQSGDLPLAVAQIEKQAAFGFGGRNLESLIVPLVGVLDAQVGVEDQQRVAHGLDDVGRVIARGGHGLLSALERVDVYEHQHRAVNLVVEGQVGARAQGIAAARFVPHFALALADGVNDFFEQGFEVGQIEIVPDVGQGAAHVGVHEVEQIGGGRREAADGQVACEYQDGQVDAGVEIVQVRIGTAEFGVVVGHLVIEGGQLFVGGL